MGRGRGDHKNDDAMDGPSELSSDTCRMAGEGTAQHEAEEKLAAQALDRGGTVSNRSGDGDRLARSLQSSIMKMYHVSKRAALTPELADRANYGEWMSGKTWWGNATLNKSKWLKGRLPRA